MWGHIRLSMGMVLLLAVGCASRKQESYAANDRVSVNAPFVKVRVGENGGAQVRAPFTNVETPRYREGAVVTTPQTVHVPVENAPPTTYQPLTPVGAQPTYPANSTSQYQSVPVIPAATPIAH